MTFAVFEFAFEGVHAFACFSAVHFEFCLAGAATSDAAGESTHGGVAIDEFWEVIFELSEFDLEFSVEGLCALCEDIEDELCAVEDFEREGLGDDASLSGGEFAIEDDVLCVLVEGEEFDLLEFSRTDEGFGIGCSSALFDDAHDFDSGGAAEFEHFVTTFVGVFFACIEVNEEGGRNLGGLCFIGGGTEFGFDGFEDFIGILREVAEVLNGVSGDGIPFG